MVDHDKSAGWDEETSRRSKSERKPRFSLKGYDFAELDVQTETLCIGEQEGTSVVPQTKASETMMTEQFENIEEETKDFPPESALPVKKAHTSVSELLEDLQGRSGSSVRTSSSLHRHVPNIVIRGKEGTSRVPPTKASETMMAELFENIEEEAQDLPVEFALPAKKAHTSVSELLEDLQGRSGSSVRTSSSLHRLIPNIASREQEVSSGVPPIKASQTSIAELLENIKEETEDLTSEIARPTKKANMSVAELLEDLQGRSGSSAGTASSLHQHTRAKDRKLKLPTSEKKPLAILGDRGLDSEDPLEHVIDETSSEEEEVIQKHLTLVNKDVKRQTMTDLFQEAFNPTNLEGTMLPTRSTGAGYYGRMQQIMQMEKDKHAEFLRQYNRDKGDSNGITVQITSRSLEGKLTVCRCLFQEKTDHYKRSINRPCNG
ncbi:hypothetical protein ACP70R_026349 [Stipagrostis hirtigluma subsp. patula]